MYKKLKNVKDEQLGDGRFFQNHLNNYLTLELIRNDRETKFCADLKNLELDTLSSVENYLKDIPELSFCYSETNGYFLTTTFEGRFRDTNREAIKAFKKFGKEANIDFNPMLSYLRNLKLSDVKRNDGDVLYNDEDFFKVDLNNGVFIELGIDSILEPGVDDDYLLVPKKGNFDGDLSMYCSLLSKEMDDPANRIGLVKCNLYPGSAPSKEVVKPLLKESVGYFLRSKVYQNEKDLPSLIEGYKDLERSVRVSKYAFDNYKDCDYPFPHLIEEIINHHSRVLTERAKLASELFSKVHLYSRAARTIIRTIGDLKEINEEFFEIADRVFKNPMGEKPVDDDYDYDDLTDDQEERISSFDGTRESICDRINFLKSHRSDIKSKVLFHLARNERKLVKCILNEQNEEVIEYNGLVEEIKEDKTCYKIQDVKKLQEIVTLKGTTLEEDYKKDGILALMNYISEFPPILTMVSHEELPMFDRLNFCLDPDIEDYESAREYFDLYKKIVETKDYLGFKDESNFLFNFVSEEE